MYRFVLAAIVLTGALSGISGAATNNVDLRYESDQVVVNTWLVAAAGDVNGDGVNDILTLDDRGSDAAYVLFGSNDQGELNPLEGISITGPGQSQLVDADGIGDVNGDGLDDVAVGSPQSDHNARDNSGTTYVVFGGTEPRTVDLMMFDLGIQGDDGFRIDGAAVFELSGHDVARAGDVNGDGLDDVLIGAPFGPATYVVFGQSGSLPVDLASFDLDNSKGYRIRTTVQETSGAGYSVAGDGDFNGDGIPDSVTGVVKDHRGRGRAYIVYGQREPQNIDARELGADGFVVTGARLGQRLGYSVAFGSDVNADGLSDILLSAPGPRYPATDSNAYVLFGDDKMPDLETSDLHGHGYKVNGSRLHYPVGDEVSMVADLNADGRDDVLIGAWVASPKHRQNAGLVFVVFGRDNTRGIRLDDLSNYGYKIQGPRAGALAGYTVAGLGDVNGDGITDVGVGAIGDGDSVPPRTHIVWSN
jgi:hypothetical protein